MALDAATNTKVVTMVNGNVAKYKLPWEAGEPSLRQASDNRLMFVVSELFVGKHTHKASWQPAAITDPDTALLCLLALIILACLRAEH